MIGRLELRVSCSKVTIDTLFGFFLSFVFPRSHKKLAKNVGEGETAKQWKERKLGKDWTIKKQTGEKQGKEFKRTKKKAWQLYNLYRNKYTRDKDKYDKKLKRIQGYKWKETKDNEEEERTRGIKLDEM